MYLFSGIVFLFSGIVFLFSGTVFLFLSCVPLSGVVFLLFRGLFQISTKVLFNKSNSVHKRFKKLI